MLSWYNTRNKQEKWTNIEKTIADMSPYRPLAEKNEFYGVIAENDGETIETIHKITE